MGVEESAHGNAFFPSHQYIKQMIQQSHLCSNLLGLYP
jgi:hypothetical protein